MGEGIIRSPEVGRAMRAVPRELFVPKKIRASTYVDSPLPIGYNQTISAPHMVAMMAEALELEVGQIVLEVGSGSGYHAAVLAEIVAPSKAKEGGYVYTIEIVPELAVFARQNLASSGYGNRVSVILGDGSLGYPKAAPYDRILVTAASPRILRTLVDELKVEGILVIPVGGLYFYQELIKVRRKVEGETTTQRLSSVAFVPLTGKNGWKV
jgi:protein-L-isoaspartate(D-aspartate) O-methyltransferase